MSEAALEVNGDGHFSVVGDLDYETVSRLLEADDILFSHSLPSVEIDLAGIGRTTSVGLALMLEWLRQAHSRNIEIRFSHVPAQMLDMAKVSQLESILHLENE